MNDKDLLLLLKIINNKANLQELIQKGYEYSQIAYFLSWAGENNYIELNKGCLILTIKGVDTFNNLKSKYRNNWIEELHEFKIPKLDIYDIYLPNGKSIKFFEPR